MIDLTPLEVRKKKGDFRRIMRGYDPALVDDFLDMVADRLEQLVRENLSLAERAGRQDQQVGEYRDRERALTEALVSAQEMREEIRKQTVREAEVAKKVAEQEATQLRATVEQEVKELRSTAQREAHELRAASQREAAELRAAAERETAELRAGTERETAEMRAAAERDSAELRSKVVVEREREEEAFRNLRARQQQFLATYGVFLERARTELDALAHTLSLGSPGDPAARPPGAAPDAFVPEGPDLAAFTAPELDDFAAPGDDPEPIDLAFAEPATGPGDVGVTEDMEFEPFEPEPLEPEDVPAPTTVPSQWQEDEPPVAADAATSADAGEPRPIGLGGTGWATPTWEGPNLDVAEPTPTINFGSPLDEGIADEDETEEMSTLLRNAEAAGYRVDELDETEELLLEEEVPKPKADEDDGWLQSLIDDEK